MSNWFGYIVTGGMISELLLLLRLQSTAVYNCQMFTLAILQTSASK